MRFPLLLLFLVILLLLLALATSSCAITHKVEVFPEGAPKQWICLDGLPVKMLQDVRCANGVCGFTCEPERWAKPER